MLFTVKLKYGCYYDKLSPSSNHTSLTGIEDTPISLAMNQDTLQKMRIEERSSAILTGSLFLVPESFQGRDNYLVFSLLKYPVKICQKKVL